MSHPRDLVALMNLTLGRAFTGQAPAGMAFPKADCAYWMTLWPGAHTCAAARIRHLMWRWISYAGTR